MVLLLAESQLDGASFAESQLLGALFAEANFLRGCGCQSDFHSLLWSDPGEPWNDLGDLHRHFMQQVPTSKSPLC